jgi:hypothetical protein
MIIYSLGLYSRTTSRVSATSPTRFQIRSRVLVLTGYVQELPFFSGSPSRVNASIWARKAARISSVHLYAQIAALCNQEQPDKQQDSDETVSEVSS